MDSNKKQIIKLSIAIALVIVSIVIVSIIILNYEKEGETNMPFVISKMVIVSTASGKDVKTEEPFLWDLDVFQNNDIYISIDKNSNFGENQVLEKVIIQNIKITEVPKKGEVKVYMPNSSDGKLYTYEEQCLVNEKLEYRGAKESNAKTLEICNQGGVALISFVNSQIGKYQTNDDIEIEHSGKLISKINVLEEEIKFKVSFELIMVVDGKSYKGTVNIDLPCENLTQEGTVTTEITDFSNVVFKRYQF